MYPPPHPPPPPSSPSKKFSCSHYLVCNYMLTPNLAVISINCYYYYTRHWIKNEYTSLYVLIMSLTPFRMNPHSIVA